MLFAVACDDDDDVVDVAVCLCLESAHTVLLAQRPVFGDLQANQTRGSVALVPHLTLNVTRINGESVHKHCQWDTQSPPYSSQH